MVNKHTRIFLKKLDTKKKLEGSVILCGFSGGSDSTSLLQALYEAQDFYDFQLQAVFFHHGYNEIAQNEDEALAFCEDFCKERDIPLLTVRLQCYENNGKGWESAARTQRIYFYNKADVDYVFLGHHADDQDETTLIQLLRGGKAAVGMSEINGKFCRPLLGVRKKHILQYLRRKNISWITDASNTNTLLTRNFLRNKAIPLLKQHYKNLNSQLESLREQMHFLYSLAQDTATIDGLEKILNAQDVDISSLSDYRLHNLIKHILAHHGLNSEYRFIQQKIKEYRKSGQLEFIFPTCTLVLSNGMASTKTEEQEVQPLFSQQNA